MLSDENSQALDATYKGGKKSDRNLHYGLHDDKLDFVVELYRLLSFLSLSDSFLIYNNISSYLNGILIMF